MKPMPDSLDVCLKPTGFIDSDSATITDLSGRLASTASDAGEKTKRPFYFVRDEIRYNVYMLSTYPEDFKAGTVLKRGKGYCVQKAVLLAALGRAVAIRSSSRRSEITGRRSS